MFQHMQRALRVAVIVLVGLVVTLVAGTALAQTGAPPAATLPGGAVVFGVVQWLVSFAIKKWEAAYNFIIGWVVLFLSFAGWAVVPASAGIFSSMGEAKHLGLGIVALLQTWVVTGAHSWILNSVVKPLAGRLGTSTSYLGPKG